MKIKNITRYTYETTAFLGWRLAFTMKHVPFCRYFSDRQYGGKDESFKACVEMKKRIFGEIAAEPKKYVEIIERYRKHK